MAAVEEILQATNPFAILGLPVREVDVTKVTTTYRRRALAVHPDKCDDARAEQAFKLLTNAFETLSSISKQRDAARRAGASEPQASRSTPASSGGAETKNSKSGEKRTRSDLWEEMQRLDAAMKVEIGARAADRRQKVAKCGQEREAERARREVEVEELLSEWGEGHTNSWRRWRTGTKAGTPAEQREDSVRETKEEGEPSRERHTCWVCRRVFRSSSALQRHEQVSELHRVNVQVLEA